MKDCLQEALRLRNELKKIIEESPISYKEYAEKIGISQQTLLDFLRAYKLPWRKTRWKIENFLKQYNKDKEGTE